MKFSHSVVEEFWHTSVHRGLRSFVYAQISSGPIAAFQSWRCLDFDWAVATFGLFFFFFSRSVVDLLGSSSTYVTQIQPILRG